MKIFKIGWGMGLLCIFLASCVSTPKPLKDVSSPVEIVEHKGTAWGIEQPSWVAQVIGTVNQKLLDFLIKKSGFLRDLVKNLSFYRIGLTKWMPVLKLELR